MTEKCITSSPESYFTNLDVKFISRETLWEERPVVVDVSNCDINHHGGIPWWGAMVCHEDSHVMMTLVLTVQCQPIDQLTWEHSRARQALSARILAWW